MTGNCRFYNISGDQHSLPSFCSPPFHRNWLDVCAQFRFFDAGWVISSYFIAMFKFPNPFLCKFFNTKCITISQILLWENCYTCVTFWPSNWLILGMFVLMKWLCFSGADNHLQLDAQICLHSKKKSPCRKITGFQVVMSCDFLSMLCFLVSVLVSFLYHLTFSFGTWNSIIVCYVTQFFPHNPSKVMVTCADSQVRILHGLNVVGKYAGMHITHLFLYNSFLFFQQSDFLEAVHRAYCKQI